MMMNSRSALLSAVVLAVILALPGEAQVARSGSPVTFGSLLDDMTDLARLARLPEPVYWTVQFSSYDRRSISPDAPGWFNNADGFGREPVPGFLEVLEKPDKKGIGLYLLADVKGPGAVVRGWSAGMGGTLRVCLDGTRAPVFEGSGYDFLARKSRYFLARAGIDLDCADAFCQQDADYMPVPFGKSLRVTWKGSLKALHFYHLEVRLYGKDIQVKTFDPRKDFASYGKNLHRAVQRLTQRLYHHPGAEHGKETDLAPGRAWGWELDPAQESGNALTEFRVRLEAADLREALRGTLLRIAFDGASRAQVEAPVGDFFGSGPGVNPINSLPMCVGPEGTMTCSFVMPYREKAVIRLFNSTKHRVQVHAAVKIAPWNWDDRSLYFRARWRTDSDLDLESGALDMPFVLVRGTGRLVGIAVMLVNPSPCATPYGSWWGEGDEKIFVDGETTPSFFGTGSEDYFNYSWSRPDLFDHPYCGQPLDSGPGNLGYVSNHRWHILDDVPFESHLAFYMELKHHRPFPGLCYSRIAYHYARPGAVDDHRRVQISELRVPDLKPMEPRPIMGVSGAVFHHFESLPGKATPATPGVVTLEAVQPGSSRGRLVTWSAIKGDCLGYTLSVKEAGKYALNIVAAHWPESRSLRILLDGRPLVVEHLGGAVEGKRGEEVLVLRSAHARRLLSTAFRPVPLKAGDHHLVLECVEPGRFGLDYLWIRKR